MALGVALLWTCRNGEAEQFTFGRGYVGPYRGGMTPEEVKAVTENASLTDAGKESGIVDQHVWELRDPESDKVLLVLYFQPRGDTLRLHTVEVRSPRYRSERGVSPADPYRKWREKHRAARAARTLRHIVVFADDLNATLEFTDEDLTDNARHRRLSEPSPSWVKPDAVPRRVLVFLDSE
ncbi:MAG: hypothetical protein GXO27_01680 [Chlorobi bacterium]|nr:hypothetical protein [Chlorobiota bacterium]